MEVVASGGVTPAPFALSPRHHLLAVGMASSAAARDAESGAARVDVLRLLRPGGDNHLGQTLQVDCVLQAPGLRRIAWSATPKTTDSPTTRDSPFETLEQLLYPAGLLAGGFEDGMVKVWNPQAAVLSDLEVSAVNDKKKPVRICSADPELALIEEDRISIGIKNMYTGMKKISWVYSQEEESTHHWDLVENDADTCEWELIAKEELPPADHHVSPKHMELVTEAQNLKGPVLGLSFNELYPYWLATGALTERICVHDLNYPMKLFRKIHEFRESGSTSKRQITCLKWHQTYPCLLGSTGTEGFLSNLSVGE